MNEIYNLLITCQRFLGIEIIEDVEKVSKISGELCRFYSIPLKYDQLGEFLAFFDEKFSNLILKNFTDSLGFFILFREIEGVLKGSKSSYQYTFVWRWLLLKHSDHIIQCITSQSSESPVVKSICHVLVNLANGANLNLPASSSEGLQMVKHIHVFVNLINEKVKSSDSVTYYMVKILAFCISTNYAIFGIMKLYGDDTIDQMVMIFFEILKEWSFDSYSAYKNFLPILSNAFNSILRVLPELIENDENFAVVLNFYKNSLIKLRDFHSEFAVKDKEVYSNFTSLLRYLVKNQVFRV